MRKYWAIARREWLSYFYSPLGYIVLAAFWFINGYIFMAVLSYLNRQGPQSISPLALVFSNTYIWLFLLFFVPVITMRLISEERKSGSIEMLLTAPVSEGTIVLAKFTAALGFYVVMWLPFAVYCLLLRGATPIDWHVVGAVALAVLLLGAFFLAVGTFASALAKNQIVAAIIAFAILIVVFSMGLLQSLANDPGVRDVFSYLNLWDHMDEFARGVVDTRRIVYYASSCALFLYLAQAAFEVKKGQ